MALKDILESIEEEAREEALDINKKAKENAKKILAEIQHDLKAVQKEGESGILKESKDIITQVEYRLRMKERNEILKAKQHLVSEALDASLKALSGLDDEAYVLLLKGLFMHMDDLEYTIFPAKDKEAHTKKALKSSKKKFVFSDISVPISGGFKAESGDIEVDNSFESLLRAEKDSLEIEVGKILFQE